jgi:hypothetical protein
MGRKFFWHKLHSDAWVCVDSWGGGEAGGVLEVLINGGDVAFVWGWIPGGGGVLVQGEMRGKGRSLESGFQS